jgi:hypothetical protein
MGRQCAKRSQPSVCHVHNATQNCNIINKYKFVEYEKVQILENDIKKHEDKGVLARVVTLHHLLVNE